MRSIQLSKSEADKLENIILKKSINTQSTKSQYEKLRVKQGNLNFILYNSLKLVFNDSNEMSELLNDLIIKEEIFDYFIGSDETGKGEWYGPLVIVAVALNSKQIKQFRLKGVQDSKRMKLSKIYEIAENTLQQQNLVYHKLILRPKKYNDLYFEFTNEKKNLNDLMAWGHSVVIKEVLSKINSENQIIKVIIDKFDFQKTEFRLKNLKSTNIKIIQKSKGESEIPVALASIIAKYYFEKEVMDLNKLYHLDLKKIQPQNLLNLTKEILFNIAKIHFKNVPF